MEIPGRLPGLNEYVEAERRNRFKAAKMKRDAQDWVILCVKKAMRGVHITRPVYIRYYWHEPNRRRDKSNISGYGRKVIEDALVEAGVLADDGWDEIEGFEDRYFLDKANPRIILEIEECLDITTNTAAEPTEKAVPASPAPGTTTNTKAMSSAAQDTGVGTWREWRRGSCDAGRKGTGEGGGQVAPAIPGRGAYRAHLQTPADAADPHGPQPAVSGAGRKPGDLRADVRLGGKRSDGNRGG